MDDRRGDRVDNLTKTHGNDPKEPYDPPAWEEEEVIEKTALACAKTPQFCHPANS